VTTQNTWLRHFAYLVASCLIAACSSSGGKDAGTDAACPAGSETCACYGNGTCNAGLTCASNLCVNFTGAGGTATTTGSGGSSGTGQAGTTGAAGSATTGSGGSPTGSGGSTMTGSGGSTTSGSGGSVVTTGTGGSNVTTGAGGSVVTTGTGGSVVTTGTGGSIVTTGTGGSPACSCPTNQQCTTDGHCTNPNVIDDFWDCNKTIDLIAGRSGGWYAAADVGINLTFAVGTPPSGFTDQTCGAWTTGGPTGNGTTTFGIMGASMTTGDLPYSFVGYSGLNVNIEGQSVGFVIKTTGTGYFQYILPATSGAQTFTVAFTSFATRGDSQVSTLNLANVTDIQFNVLDPSKGYGFVVHALSLY
jgi:hypothetical protein